MPAAEPDLDVVAYPDVDLRPRFGIGHVVIEVSDVSALTAFYIAIGMRLVVDLGEVAILELRGGTHLRLESGASAHITLDLIVDDIDDTWAVLDAFGARPTVITQVAPHDRFTATDPDGNVLVVNSNHAVGQV